MSFDTFKFDSRVSSGIAACGYSRPTPIQHEAIGPLLAGRDLLGLAQTGTGKTAAFALPLLQRLLRGPRSRVRALVIAPTRELAAQIHDNITMLARATGLKSVVVYGGVGKQPQKNALAAGAEIVVACPGRLLDLHNERSIDLRRVEILVLDEADHMFDKGFLPDIRHIVRLLPTKRQNMIFSATMPEEIRRLADGLLHDPAVVQMKDVRPPAAIAHILYQVSGEEKTSLLKSLISRSGMGSTLVFTRTKHRAKSLSLHLQKAGFRAVSLQGNLSQSKRQCAMEGFRNGTYSILVATDIAARGIDVSGISHVINYDLPDTVETYTHRVGRTGRAGRDGEAMTFAGSEDGAMVARIEHLLGMKMRRESLSLQVKAIGNRGNHPAQTPPVEAGGPQPERSCRQSGREQDKVVQRRPRRRSRARACDFGLNNAAR